MIMNQFIVMCICKRKKKSNAEISHEMKLKYRLTQTFDKLSYFLQSLRGSSYWELTEKTLNEKTRWNMQFHQVGLWG